ncbi:MAG: geranylgeranyl reductase family protein [Armatimonadetes bacterium]|nr:geranylgeranyl reductase family protein [Armatimonadota bacterium]
MIYDVIVCGLGPAGAMSAYELSKAGMNVLALEKKKMPRYKACGGCLSPKIIKIIPVDISDLIERTVYTVGFTYCFKEEFLISAKRPIGHMLMRDKFDYLLAEKAKETGTVIKEDEALIALEESKEFIKVKTSKGDYQTRFLIGSDGANSIVAKSNNLAKKKRLFLTLTSEIFVNMDLLEENSKIAWVDMGNVPYGYAWIFPKGKHVTLGLGVFQTKKNSKSPISYLHKFINSHKLLKGAKLQKVYGHLLPTLVDSRVKISKGRVFLIGDAAGLVDPFLGEGIYYALRSAQIISNLILNNNGNLEELNLLFHKNIHQELFPHFKAAEKISRFVFNFPRYSYSLLRDHKLLADFYQNVMQGEDSYETVFARMINKVKLGFKEGASKQWRKVLEIIGR